MLGVMYRREGGGVWTGEGEGGGEAWTGRGEV